MRTRGFPPLPCRRATAWRPSAAPLRRHRCRQSVRATAAPAAVEAVAASELQRIAAGGKLTKTAVVKLPVGDLRAECQRLQLPSDGLKAALVERLLGWWEQQQQQLQQEVAAGTSSGGSPPAEAAVAVASAPVAATAPAPATAIPAAAAFAAAPAAAPPSSSGQGAVGRQQKPPQRHHQQDSRQKGVMDVNVTWLGTSSGSPTPRRNVSGIAGKRSSCSCSAVQCGAVRRSVRVLVCRCRQRRGGRQCSRRAGVS